MNTDPLPFTFAWLEGAGRTRQPLTVCTEGHLVVRGRSHWAPRRISADLHALWCEPVVCDSGPDN
jgi:hypothetical protein